jgi:hypothetical protein
VVRVENRVSIAHVAATLAVAFGLCIVVVAVLVSAAGVVSVLVAAAADAVLVAHQVHPATVAGNPQA